LFTPRYNWNTAKVGIKHQSINPVIIDRFKKKKIFSIKAYILCLHLDFKEGVIDCTSETKDYKIGICCFSAKNAPLRRKSKDLMARNQNNGSEWGHISIHRLLFQWANTVKIQLSMLVLYKVDFTIISLKINGFEPTTYRTRGEHANHYTTDAVHMIRISTLPT
jgi:hypothetical protein